MQPQSFARCCGHCVSVVDAHACCHFGHSAFLTICTSICRFPVGATIVSGGGWQIRGALAGGAGRLRKRTCCSEPAWLHIFFGPYARGDRRGRQAESLEYCVGQLEELINAVFLCGQHVESELALGGREGVEGAQRCSKRALRSAFLHAGPLQKLFAHVRDRGLARFPHC